MPTKWDIENTIIEEVLARHPAEHHVEAIVIQHTSDNTYQVLLKRTHFKQWTALATRRAPRYPRQFLRLPALLARLAMRFPYIKEVKLEELSPRVQVLQLPHRRKP